LKAYVVVCLAAILCASVASAVPNNQAAIAAQLKNSLIVNTQSELAKTQGQINETTQKKAALEEQLAKLKGVEGVARSFALKSKLKDIEKNKQAIHNDLQQLDIDLRSLRDRYAVLSGSVRTANFNHDTK
jgi:peptidoglycan hydrolase CwlO-like protein